jgi:hypothetical protein
VVEREEACRYAAFQWERLWKTRSDAEEPKDGESEVVVASHRSRGRKIGTRAGEGRLNSHSRDNGLQAGIR